MCDVCWCCCCCCGGDTHEKDSRVVWCRSDPTKRKTTHVHVYTHTHAYTNADTHGSTGTTSIWTMRFSLAAVLGLIALCDGSDAFTPKAFHRTISLSGGNSQRSLSSSSSTTASTRLPTLAAAAAIEVPTKPIAGMKPGTSGLRKKVEVWQGVDETNKYYVENFIQSLIDTAKANNGDKTPDT